MSPSWSELLTKKFRWPTAGDKLFSEASEPIENARVAGNAYSRLHIMTDGYKRAADKLVQHALDAHNERDFLVYPIIFCYRHFLELSLKAMLAMYGPKVGVPANWNSHDLQNLWTSFKQMLRQYEVEGDAESIVGECVAEFAATDSSSFIFRYPLDTKGRPQTIPFARLDLARLRDVMEGIDSYFNGTDGYLSNLDDAGSDGY